MLLMVRLYLLLISALILWLRSWFLLRLRLRLDLFRCDMFPISLVEIVQWRCVVILSSMLFFGWSIRVDGVAMLLVMNCMLRIKGEKLRLSD